MRVGVFDSGVGGLTVLKSLIKYHPNNEYYYYGDTLNVPYGDKTVDELYDCVKIIIDYLKAKKVEAIVIACGTVSANLYDRLKSELDIPIYSIISEVPKYVSSKNYKKTLVLATSATINSHIFKRILNNDVIEVACPKLVPIIESEQYNDLDKVLDEYLIDAEGIDSLILGCTHYPMIEEQIRRKVGNDVDIIDMGEVFSQRVEFQDSFSEVNLFFSKKTKNTEKYVNKLLKTM